MRTMIRTLCVAAAAFASHATAAVTEPAIIPRPLHVVERTGSVVIADGTPVVAAAADDDAGVAARYLVDLAGRLGGPTLRLATAAPAAAVAVRFVHRGGMAAEGYALDIDARGVTITASTRSARNCPMSTASSWTWPRRACWSPRQMRARPT